MISRLFFSKIRNDKKLFVQEEIVLWSQTFKPSEKFCNEILKVLEIIKSMSEKLDYREHECSKKLRSRWESLKMLEMTEQDTDGCERMEKSDVYVSQGVFLWKNPILSESERQSVRKKHKCFDKSLMQT